MAVDWIDVLRMARWRPDGVPHPEMMQGTYVHGRQRWAIATSGAALILVRDPKVIRAWGGTMSDGGLVKRGPLVDGLIKDPPGTTATVDVDALGEAVAKAKINAAKRGAVPLLQWNEVAFDARLLAVGVVSPARQAVDKSITIDAMSVGSGRLLRARGTNWISAVMERHPGNSRPEPVPVTPQGPHT